MPSLQPLAGKVRLPFPGDLPAGLLLFVAGWTLINALQAAFTELNPDEAYYYMYAQRLAWGYFDHPPAIALMIRLGSSLLPGELGVRLATVLLSAGGMLLLWDLVKRPAKPYPLSLFLLLAAGMPFFHVYGFVATPDSPLLFFSLLFYVLFRRFLSPSHRGIWVALGICMAALLYSKYHGILVIGIAALTQPAVWRDPRFYYAALLGALLFAPHLYWQFDQDFPSLRYHLVERNNPFQLKHLLTYLGNQVLTFNPFLFPLLAWAVWQGLRRPGRWIGPMGRTYLATALGFWGFFLLTVVRGHVEPHWTAVVSIPLVVLGFAFAREHSGYARWLRRLALFSLIPLAALRISVLKGVLTDTVPLFHRSRWVYDLHREVGEYPVLFDNSYRRPSMYHFYTGHPAYTAFSIGASRANQFNLWPWEEELQGRRLAALRGHDRRCGDCRTVNLAGDTFYLQWIPQYPTAPRLALAGEATGGSWVPGSHHTLPVTVRNPWPDSAYLSRGDVALRPVAVFRSSGESRSDPSGKPRWWIAEAALKKASFGPQEQVTTTLTFRVPDEWAGAGTFGVSVQVGTLDPRMPDRMLPVRILPGTAGESAPPPDEGGGFR